MNPAIIFHEALVRPIISVLVGIYQLLLFLHIPYPLGFSIIVLTILIRLVLYPFTKSQLKASRKMQELTPHLSRVKQKHKGDAKKIQEETMKLYKEFGVNPAAGCLPTLIQLPIIWALYGVFQQIVGLKAGSVVAVINGLTYNAGWLKLAKPWDVAFFGIPIGQNPSHLLTTLGPIVFAVPLITGLLQYVQSKTMFAPAATQPSKDKKEKKSDDFASAFQTQSMYIFPLMIGFFSYSFPVGISLYWNTFTIFGILQQSSMQDGGIKGVISNLKKKLTGKK